jgi:hypothetical protein
MDLFVVPTIGFDLLYAFVIIRLDRRDIVWTSVTANPTDAIGNRDCHRHSSGVRLSRHIAPQRGLGRSLTGFTGRHPL